MPDWLTRSAEHRPGEAFLEMGDRSVTFDELEDRVQEATAALLGAGVGVGDRVALWVRSDIPTVVALFAIPRTGSAQVLLNTRLAVGELKRQVVEAATSWLVGDDAPDLGLPRLSIEGQARSEGIESKSDLVHTIASTSGSSGRPRGVMLTWGNIEASAAAAAAHLEHTSEDRWLGVLPLYHVGGMAVLIRSAREGSTVVLEESFDARRAAKLLRIVTLASLVPQMLGRILDVDPGTYEGVRAVLVGGGPSPQLLLERAVEAGLPVLSTYGMTETASQIATSPLTDGLTPKRRVWPLGGAEIRVDGEGRVEVKGPMVSPGYVDQPLRQGEWFRTGDTGIMDADGFLRVTGRADDLIISGGEKVHPAEVEAQLVAHPGVVEVAVVGAPSESWGEAVVVAVVGSADVDELLEFGRQRLGGFERPKAAIKVDRLPRTALGKVDREAVKNLFERTPV